MKTFLILIFSLLQIGFLVGVYGASHGNQLPQDWYLSPEDQPQMTMAPAAIKGDIENNKLSEFLERIYGANLEVLSKIPERTNPPKTNKTEVPNHAPWHLEAAITELAVYAKGLLGVLTMKGQPAVQVFWRRQGPKPADVLNQPIQPEPEAMITQVFDDNNPEQTLAKEMEPMIQSALATGKIKDEMEFRRQIMIAAQEFKYVSSGLDGSKPVKWFLAWLRFDFIVGASGKVYAAPLVTVGGDLRLRFDWHRHQRKVPAGSGRSVVKPVGTHILAQDLDKFRDDLRDFMIGIQKDLEVALAKARATSGMQAYAFKIALGMTANGTIGVAKGNVGVFGHMNFVNTTPSPVVYPAPPKVAAMETEDEDNVEDGELAPLYVIENAPSEQHLNFADRNGIAYSMNKSTKEVHFKVDRKAFRKGLMRAVQMGQFFAKIGQHKENSKKESRPWKMFQMKTGFELSLSGVLDIVTIGGTASAEMAFFNMNF